MDNNYKLDFVYLFFWVVRVWPDVAHLKGELNL